MATSEEYLASLGFDTSDVNKAVNQTISVLAALGDRFDGLEKYTSRAEKALLKTGASGREAAAGIQVARKAANEGSSAWQAYVKSLADANSAYKEFRRGQVTGEGGGTNISALSTADQDKLLSTYEAQNSGVIAAIRERQRAEQDAASNREREDRVYNQLLAEQEAAYKRAADAAIAQSDKRTAAIVADYAREFAAAEKAAQTAASTQLDRRNALPQRASNNNAPTVTARNNASSEYDAQAQAQLRAYYAELERGTAAQAKNNAAVGDGLGNLPRLRYALYDVSFATAAVSTGLLASGVAITLTTARYEALFASVIRTTKGFQDVDFSGLREQLLDLTSEIPATFEQITAIATLGNQLNIDPSNLANFTKVVAEFSATTNVSVDATATAFGRLGELLNTTDYRGLGDDIAYLGVNAVATEGQIIALAQQIAVSANAAGFSEKQTIALATAMSSLGTAPEAARGTILRVFSQINSSVQSGGQALNDFAAISGTTSEDFANKWRTDASGAFTQFVTGLGSDTNSINSNLSALGITATRDQQAIGLLAQNFGVLTRAQDDTAESAGHLNDSFAVIADTTASKFQILQNNIQRVFDTIGQSTNGPVKGALDGLNAILEETNDLLSNPLVAGGVAFSATVVTLAGVAGLATAAGLRFVATLIAVRTAAAEAGASELTLSGVMQLLTQRNLSAAASGDAVAASQVAMSSSGNVAAASQGRLAASSGAASVQGGKLSSALGKAGMVGALLALLPLLPAVYTEIDSFTQRAIGNQDSVEGMTQKINGLTDAAAKAQAQGAIEKLLNFKSVPYSDTGNPYARDQEITGPQAYYNQQKTGQAVPGKEISYFGNGGAINNIADQAKKNIEDYDAALAQLATSGNLDAVNAGVALFTANLEKQGLSSSQARELLTQTNAALGLNADGSAMAGAAAEDAANSAEEAASAFESYLDAAFGAANAERAVSESFESLGEAFYNNGAAAAASGPEIQKAISDIYASASSGPEAAAQMQALFDALVSGGFASAQQLSGLQAVIFQLTGGKGVKAATVDMSSFTNGLNKAAKAAAGSGGSGSGGAAKAVRTLVDYANDLSSVFKRASEIRFAPQMGLDGINSSWLSIRSTITEANKAIQSSITSTNLKVNELNATIQGLAADNAINRYFLSIAENYGDVLRATELRAQIAETNAKIKSSSADLAKAQADGAQEVATEQEKTNKTLVGNSAAAIANRAEIQGLIGNYQTYIASLASSGLSQAQLEAKTAQLKAEFIRQATQLGYTETQVFEAARAFDDMTLAIQRVPRNITVSANTNPALQALNEFEAKAKSLAGKTYSGGTVTAPVYDNTSAAKNARLQVLQAELAAAQGPYQRAIAAGADNVATRYLTKIQDISNKINSGNYYTGGYTGNGNTRAPAGVVHGKEFVLNATGARMLPMSQLNAMNQGRAPQVATMSVAGGRSGYSGPTELSQADRALLIDIRDNIGLFLPGGAAQQLVNAENSNSDRLRSN